MTSKNKSLPELVARWRAEAMRTTADADDAMKLCADELEAALTREAPTEGVGGDVVQRARELLAAEYVKAGWPDVAETVLNGAYHPNSMRAVELAAITAALTEAKQQTGEIDAFEKLGSFR